MIDVIIIIIIIIMIFTYCIKSHIIGTARMLSKVLECSQRRNIRQGTSGYFTKQRFNICLCCEKQIIITIVVIIIIIIIIMMMMMVIIIKIIIIIITSPRPGNTGLMTSGG